MKSLAALALLTQLTLAPAARAADQPTPVATPVASAPATFEMKLPVPEIERLPNGLEVAWFLSDSLPIIDLALMVRSGHRDDAPGKSGTAELVAETLDRGAGTLSARAISQAIESLGASRYATAGDDSFSVGMHGLAPDGGRLLELLAAMVTQPTFAETEVLREKARLLDRWTHIGDYGEILASLAYSRTMAAGTSYGRGSLASARELAKLGRADVVAFHRSHFTPQNSILMVVGRANRAEFSRKILAAFGGWKGEAPARDWKNYADARLPKPGAKRANRILLIDRPGLTQAQVRIGFRAPLIQHPDHYALVVANALTGEYFNSRLNSLIRDKLGLTYSIASSFSYSKDLASFTIASSTRNESVAQLLEKTYEVLKGMKGGPITEDESAMAKEYLVGGFPLANSTLGAAASRWLSGHIYGLGPDYLNEFVPRVALVKGPDVQAAVKQHFDLGHLVIAVSGDAKEIGKSLDGLKAKFGPVVRLKLSDLQ